MVGELTLDVPLYQMQVIKVASIKENFPEKDENCQVFISSGGEADWAEKYRQVSSHHNSKFLDFEFDFVACVLLFPVWPMFRSICWQGV